MSTISPRTAFFPDHRRDLYRPRLSRYRPGYPQAPRGIHSRALITAVDNSKVRTHLIVKTNLQYLTVQLLDGPHQGQGVAGDQHAHRQDGDGRVL